MFMCVFPVGVWVCVRLYHICLRALFVDVCVAVFFCESCFVRVHTATDHILLYCFNVPLPSNNGSRLHTPEPGG